MLTECQNECFLGASKKQKIKINYKIIQISLDI